MAFFDGIWTAPEIDQFISRTPTLGAYDEARFIFDGHKALVRIRQSHPHADHGMLEVEILSRSGGQQFSSLLKICTSSSHLLLAVENLYIDGYPSSSLYGNTKWVDLLLLFTAVKNLYVSKSFSVDIALALQELVGRKRTTTEVLPVLKNVLLEGSPPWKISNSVQEVIGHFIFARQLTNNHVALSVWDRDPI